VKEEKVMSSDKKKQTPNKQAKVATPDALTKTTKEGSIELREEELKRTTGGTIKLSGIPTGGGGSGRE
jgi:hypothetical protein